MVMVIVFYLPSLRMVIRHSIELSWEAKGAVYDASLEQNETPT
jgi:hypothetical protein